jgi:hypothetical protein
MLAAMPLQAATSAFAPGEQLVYRIRWGFITAGTATLTVLPNREVNGQPARRFVFKVESAPWLQHIYQVRTKITSLTDLGITRSLHYTKNQREGDTAKDIIVRFDWTARQATYSNSGKERKPVSLSGPTLDPLSAVYAFRTRTIDSPGSFQITVTDGKHVIPAKGDIRADMLLKTKAGRFATWLIEPEIKNLGGVFKKSPNAKLQLWFSDDPRHLLVRVRSKVIVGAFTADLVRIDNLEPTKNAK